MDLSASSSDRDFERIQIGLRQHTNGNFYFPRSGMQLVHEGPNRSRAWRSKEPDLDKSCVTIDLEYGPELLESFIDEACEALVPDFTLCEIPYAN